MGMPFGYGVVEEQQGIATIHKALDLEVARTGDSQPRSSWPFAGSTEAYPRDDLERV